MAVVINQTARRPLGVRGVTVQPGEMKEVNISEAQLATHPFVREGWLYVDKSSVQTPKRKASKKQEQPSDGGESQESGEE